MKDAEWEQRQSLSGRRGSKASCDDEDQEQPFLPVLPTGHLTPVIVLVGSQINNEVN